MKKVFFLFLFVAFLGGYQFVSFPQESKPATPQKSGQINTADILIKNKECAIFREKLEEKITKDESIESLFYSPKTNSCLYEKRTRKENGVEVRLINIFSKEEIALWSSESDEPRYQDYLNILGQYQ